eukprot:TRINITY_DN8614_c0_g1_i1.p1 TRINITY_DN8614_c0_g1~~TRINITY_DN8614_c0_g1_i1.p1  ORF type:complete len:141 (-),score=0.34 TRINITY_DN8614_c0_g1_i1:78-500(-)
MWLVLLLLSVNTISANFCYWYGNNTACTAEEDAHIESVYTKLVKDNENADLTVKEPCNYRLALLLCQPCSPQRSLPICDKFCLSISYRCTHYKMPEEVTNATECCSGPSGSECLQKDCFNSSTVLSTTFIIAVSFLLVLL